SLQAGNISASSTDAVNGSQLFTTNQNVTTVGTNIANTFGGGAGYENGKWTAPEFKVATINSDGSLVAEKNYKSVAEAFEGVGTSFTNIHQELKNEISQVVGDSLVKQDADTHVIAIGGEKSGTQVTLANIDSAARILSGVKAGTLSEESTDAVNGSQLYRLGSNVAKSLGGNASYKDGTWTDPSFKVKTVHEDGQTEDEEYSDVASAFAGVGTSFTNIKNEINKEITHVVSDSLVKFDEKTNLIKIGGEKEGARINIADKDSKDRILSGVKKAENDNEAVNKGQLDESLKGLSNSLQSDDSAVVHYDKNTDENGTTNYASVTFGKGKDSAAVGLHNVADGAISEGSHDVVNGGQINKISQDVAKFLGGEAKFSDGAFTGPTYKLS
ncbi:hypothetical protein MEI_01507, partial [Bartonella vinsonii subsp. arupensis Pm136co]